MLPNHDVAWILWLAEQLVDGRELYSELIEVNPPLIVWLCLPIVLLARSANLDPATLYHLAVALLILVCTFIAAQVGHRTRWSIVLATVTILGPLAGADFGQRDHLAVVLFLPMLVATVRQREGATLTIAQVTGVGLLAGLAICLKPFLAPVWLLVAAYRRPAREDAVIMSVGIGYLLAVVLLTPDYFTLIALLAERYRTFVSQPVTRLLSSPPFGATLALAIAWMLERRRSPAADVLVLAAVGALLSPMLQQKGWSYHWYPALALATLAVPFIASRRWPTIVAIGLMVVAVGHFVVESYKQVLARSERAHVLQALMGEYPRVLVLTGNFLDVWPGIGSRWAGTLPCLWWTSDPLTGDAAEAWLLDRARSDLASRPPLVIVETPARHFAVTKNTHHPLALLGPLHGYRLADSAGGLAAWVLDSSSFARAALRGNDAAP